MRTQKFITTNADWKQFHRGIKLYRCPHCQRTGSLILHGYLYGYDDTGDYPTIVRGRRVFCSNRGHRQGCGLTFSILLAHILKNFTITTRSLGCFLDNILNGLNKFQAFTALALPFSASSIYRLYKKILLAQQHIRTCLLKISPPPAGVPSDNPLIQTILHVKRAFPGCPDPFAAFQLRFQAGLLG